jgi:hypothetical protein
MESLFCSLRKKSRMTRFVMSGMGILTAWSYGSALGLADAGFGKPDPMLEEVQTNARLASARNL